MKRAMRYPNTSASLIVFRFTASSLPLSPPLRVTRAMKDDIGAAELICAAQSRYRQNAVDFFVSAPSQRPSFLTRLPKSIVITQEARARGAEHAEERQIARCRTR